MNLKQRRERLKKYLQYKLTEQNKENQIILKRKSGVLPKRALDFFQQKYQIDNYVQLNQALDIFDKDSQDYIQFLSDLKQYDMLK